MMPAMLVSPFVGRKPNRLFDAAGTRIDPQLSDPRRDRVRTSYDDDDGWLVLYRGRLAVVCNFAAERRSVPLDGRPDGVLLASAGGFVFRPEEIDLDADSVAIVTLAG